MIRAPCMTAWAILPRAILPCGSSTIGVIPARLAYAAIEAEVLPVDAQTTAVAPCSAAMRDGHRHTAVLERPGRVVGLDLQPHRAAGQLRQPAGLDERGAALAQA